MVLHGDYVNSSEVLIRGPFSAITKALGELLIVADERLETGSGGLLLVAVSDCGNTGFSDDSGVDAARMGFLSISWHLAAHSNSSAGSASSATQATTRFVSAAASDAAATAAAPHRHGNSAT